MTHEILRELPLFVGLSHSDLDLLEERSQTVDLQTGDILMSEGTTGGSLYVILEGEFEIVKRSGTQDVLLAVRGPGEVIGEMSLLDQMPRTATVRALAPSRLLEIDHEAFRHLLQASSSAAISILRTITARLRNTESMLRQSEKMVALGTLAAGLAHELNNPAAALARSADQMKDVMAAWVETGASLSGAQVAPAAIREALEMGARSGSSLETLDPIEAGRVEAAMEAWLESQGVDRSWELAPALTAGSWKASDLEAWAATVPIDKRAAWLGWLGWMVSASRLLAEVALSAGRISEIVSSVKSYAYLDRAPVQPVDLHAGIEHTLVILRHKLEPGVRVLRRFASDLPPLEAYGSELNQVWTNLIDNAVQAMDGAGEITITTAQKGEETTIAICDSGPGIPRDIQGRIFEPFFTTKPPGSGTGLGLNLVYNIVVHRHGGRIEVDSVPGRTCFTVTLPPHPRGSHER